MLNTTPSLGEMNLDEFRQYGYQLIDWIADYLEHPERYSVLSQVQPGAVRSQLPELPPQKPEAMDCILADFEHVVLPGVTHWNHPSFFAYFGITGSGPGILGELLTAALNVNAMLWRTSPSATELEEVTLAWLLQMTGLPGAFRGVIVDTASISSLLAVTAAREALDLDIRQQGMAGRPGLPPLRMYLSDQAHSSIEKAALTLGIGQKGVRKISSDQHFRMDPQALALAIEEDLAVGWRPFCVTATAGTTSTTSIDPVPQIARICKQYGLWLHVDGAYGGMAAIVPEMRYVLAGCEEADSLVINPHKWLFTPMDCSVLYVRNPDVLKRAFSLVPEYLKTSETDVTNYMDWGVQLGRRFRALKLWMIIRYFGHEGLAARIREHIRLAAELAGLVDADLDFERLAPTPLSTICFRACPADLAERLEHADTELRKSIEAYLDHLNETIIHAVNTTGLAFLSHTRLNGHYTIRMAIGNIRTTLNHVLEAWNLIRNEARHLDGEQRPALLGALSR
jgi:aromatic-L-amino-acid decarboxylase